MVEKLNKRLFKIEILVLKIITFAIGFCYFLNTLFSYFNIDNIVLSNIAGVGVLPLLFIYIASYTHGFCLYHRLFIIYIAINNILSFIDYTYGIPISDKHYVELHFIISFIFMCLIVYTKLKLCKKH